MAGPAAGLWAAKQQRQQSATQAHVQSVSVHTGYPPTMLAAGSTLEGGRGWLRHYWRLSEDGSALQSNSRWSSGFKHVVQTDDVLIPRTESDWIHLLDPPTRHQSTHRARTALQRPSLRLMPCCTARNSICCLTFGLRPFPGRGECHRRPGGLGFFKGTSIFASYSRMGKAAGPRQVLDMALSLHVNG